MGTVGRQTDRKVHLVSLLLTVKPKKLLTVKLIDGWVASTSRVYGYMVKIKIGLCLVMRDSISDVTKGKDEGS